MEVAMAWAPNTIPARTLVPPRAAVCPSCLSKGEVPLLRKEREDGEQNVLDLLCVGIVSGAHTAKLHACIHTYNITYVHT